MPDELQSVLDASPLPKEAKGKVWDAYHGTQTPEQFQSAFDNLPIDKAIKAKLWDLKFGQAKTQTDTSSPPQASKKPFDLKSFVGQATGRAEDAMGHAAVGAVRRATSTVQAIAAPIRKTFGMAPATAPDAETTRAGQVGRAVEQVGEFFIPAGLATKFSATLRTAARLRQAGMATKAAKLLGTLPEAVLQASGAYGLLKAQGATDPKTGAAIAAAGPLAGAAAPMVAQGMKAAAVRQLAKVFGSSDLEPVGFRKAIAKIVPTALDLGIPLTWERWAKRAEQLKSATGQAVKNTVAGAAGDMWAPTKPIIDALTDLEERSARIMMKMPTESADFVAVGEEAAFNAQERGATAAKFDETGYEATSRKQGMGLSRPEAEQHLRDAGWGQGQTKPEAVGTKDETLLRMIGYFRTKLQNLPSDQVPVRVLHDLKQTWNAFTKYAGREAKDETLRDLILQSKGRAAEVATNAIRDVISQAAPTVHEVDQAYSIATRLHQAVVDSALEATGKAGTKITAGFTGAMKRQAVIGATTGAAAGGSETYRRTGSPLEAAGGAIVGGLTGRMLEQAFRSPLWVTKGPQIAHALSKALSSQDADRVRRLLMPFMTRAGGNVSKEQETVQP